MATHKSAIKRHRQSLKRRERNKGVKSAVRTVFKKAVAAAQGGHAKLVNELLREANRAIAKAASKGIYKKRTAARKISRLATLAQKVKKG